MSATRIDSNMLDHDLLLAEVARDPQNTQSVFFLAQSYFELGDFVNARKWYAQRAEMGGWDEEIYYSMFRGAESLLHLGTPWAEVEEAFLRAWEFRPTRAEPLYFVASWYRANQRYWLGYLYAERAAEIPLPDQDKLFVRSDIYSWRITDELAVCASWIGKQAESFTLCRRLLANPDVPDAERPRIAGNRDVCAPTMLNATSSYPDMLAQQLQRRSTDPNRAEVVVSLVAGPDLHGTEQTLNSFLHCCTDVSRVGRFLVLDAGLSAEDRAALQERYKFLEFVDSPLAGIDGPIAQVAYLRAQINERLWLHLAQGWQFFAPENLITRLAAVLQAEPEVFQVAINFADAVELTGLSAPETVACRAPNAGRYVRTQAVARGPAMFDTARLDQAGGIEDITAKSLHESVTDRPAIGLDTASLDEVLALYVGYRQ